MMGGYGYRQDSDSTKWIVLLLTGLVIGGVILVAYATGTFNPKTAAEARQIDAQTAASQAQAQLDNSRARVDADIYKKRQEAQLVQEQALYGAQLQFQNEQYRQQLEQAQREFEQDVARHDFAVRGLVAAAEGALIILTLGVVWGAGKVITSKYGNDRPTSNQPKSDERDEIRLRALGEITTTLKTLVKQSAYIENAVSKAVDGINEMLNSMQAGSNETHQELARTREELEGLLIALKEESLRAYALLAQMAARLGETKRAAIDQAARGDDSDQEGKDQPGNVSTGLRRIK